MGLSGFVRFVGFSGAVVAPLLLSATSSGLSQTSWFVAGY